MEKEEKSTKSIKGMVNTHEKAAPEFKVYPDGNTRLTLNLLHKDKEGTQLYTDVVAYNKNAERLYSLINGAGIKEFTFTGNLKENEKYNNQLRVTNFLPHQVIQIEGEIKHIKKAEKVNDALDIFIVSKNENVEQKYNVIIRDNQDRNGAVIEKGNTIAVKGLSSQFQLQDDTRSTKIDSWNVAPDTTKLEKVIEEAKAKAAEKKSEPTKETTKGKGSKKKTEEMAK